MSNQLSFGGKHLYEPMIALVILIVLYNTAGYLALRFGKPKYMSLHVVAAKSTDAEKAK